MMPADKLSPLLHRPMQIEVCSLCPIVYPKLQEDSKAQRLAAYREQKHPRQPEISILRTPRSAETCRCRPAREAPCRPQCCQQDSEDWHHEDDRWERARHRLAWESMKQREYWEDPVESDCRRWWLDTFVISKTNGYEREANALRIDERIVFVP